MSESGGLFGKTSPARLGLLLLTFGGILFAACFLLTALVAYADSLDRCPGGMQCSDAVLSIHLSVFSYVIGAAVAIISMRRLRLTRHSNPEALAE
ncbi:MAG: hypothetical protein KTR19_12125 [Hyphomicrobiales bacterium]|nr:hypothetical protein [Hyphomicrobiales bacterium]